MSTDTATTPMPMFPLGSVLLPTMVLPLHVFEPRYRALVDDVLAADRRFGVVLIERGSEVGGGDERSDIGTVAEIVDHEKNDDGRVALVAVGTDRITVDRWLPDDPYPQALVRVSPDVGSTSAIDLEPQLRVLRRSLALQAELGEARAPVDVVLDEDPATATFQIAAVGPFGPLDRRRVLAETDPAARAALLAELLDDAIPLLEARLGAG